MNAEVCTEQNTEKLTTGEEEGDGKVKML